MMMPNLTYEMKKEKLLLLFFPIGFNYKSISRDLHKYQTHCTATPDNVVHMNGGRGGGVGGCEDVPVL